MNLKKLRVAKGISQKDLANQFSVSPTNIYNYEAGRTEPSIDMLIKLADFFDCTVDVLVGRFPMSKYEYQKEKTNTLLASDNVVEEKEDNSTEEVEDEQLQIDLDDFFSDVENDVNEEIEE